MLLFFEYHSHKLSTPKYAGIRLPREDINSNEEKTFPLMEDFSPDRASHHQTPIFFIRDQIWTCEMELKI